KIRDDQKKTLETDLAALQAKLPALNEAITTAAAEFEPLNKRAEELKPILADLKSKLQNVADANPLADAPVLAQIRSYDGGQWRDLAVTPQGSAREFDLAVPDVSAGVYRLKVGVKGDDKVSRPIAVESWVSIARDVPFSVGLFTNRGRDSFYRGEGFWLGLGIVSVKGAIAAGK